MYWITTSQQNLAIILLNFEKTYDRINGFLESTLFNFGFSLLWLRALIVDASIQILVNGQKGQPFSLRQSIRQGCPLAPYIFFFIAKVLGYMLDNTKYGVEILKLPI